MNPSRQTNDAAEILHEANDFDASALVDDAALAEPTSETLHSVSPTEEEDTPSADPPLGELDTLRAEVARLRESLEKKEREQAEALRELEEFNRLFPEIPLRQIPSSVWEKRQGGLPLNAAYALYERERARASARADAVNQANAARSAGQAGVHTEREYFSPDEVRAMTPAQVRQNYQRIRESMKTW